MEIANCWLTLDKFGSNIPLFNVTPAELVYLVENRKNILGRFPISDLEKVRNVPLSEDNERKRLQMKYGRVKSKEPGVKPYCIDVLFPPHTSKLPTTFKDTPFLEEASAIKVASDVIIKAPDDSEVPSTLQTEDYWKEEEKPVAKAPVTK